jgi:hypothetical protein
MQRTGSPGFALGISLKSRGGGRMLTVNEYAGTTIKLLSGEPTTIGARGARSGSLG